MREVFKLIESGDLVGLKTLTKDMPPADLVKMQVTGQLYTPLIQAVNYDRHEIVRWLVDEKGANVNEMAKNETALQRAIFRNNDTIVRDLLGYGANVEHRIPNMNLTMPLFAIMRGQAKHLDLMLETGVSTKYEINSKPVTELLKQQDPEIEQVHFKHERWRRLRQFLKLEDQVGMGTSRAEKRLKDKVKYPSNELT